VTRVPTIWSLVPLAFALVGCSSGGVDCVNGVDWRLTMEPPETTHALRLTVCRNAVCSIALFHSDGHIDGTSGPFGLRVGVDGRTSWTIDVHLGDRTSDLHDGDVYTYTLDDLTAGRTLYDFKSKPVVYSRRSNGDAECVSANLSPS
jgi:hypothetical protein